MRNTLPLSSFPLQALLTFETYYQPFLSIFIFFLLLFKTFNLPYTPTMMAQEGVLQGLFLVFNLIRIRIGKIANRVFFNFEVDWRLDMDDWVYPSNFRVNDAGDLFFGDSVLSAAGGVDSLNNHDCCKRLRAFDRIFFLLAVPKLRKTAMIFILVQLLFFLDNEEFGEIKKINMSSFSILGTQRLKLRVIGTF